MRVKVLSKEILRTLTKPRLKSYLRSLCRLHETYNWDWDADEFYKKDERYIYAKEDPKYTKLRTDIIDAILEIEK